MKDLNKLSKEIYEANKAKGFHEVKHSLEHLFCLVISELMEAVEADRKGRRADWKGVVNLWYIREMMNYDSYCRYFEEHIKDTVEDELADAVIRQLDVAGTLDLNLKARIKENNFYYYGREYTFKKHLFTENICNIVDRYFINNRLTIDNKISNMIFDIDILCEVMNIDLWQHIELKLKYNSLRPYKHGKAY